MEWLGNDIERMTSGDGGGRKNIANEKGAQGRSHFPYILDSTRSISFPEYGNWDREPEEL